MSVAHSQCVTHASNILNSFSTSSSYLSTIIMARYGRRGYQSYARSGNKFFYKKCQQKAGRAMTQLINRAVARSTQACVSYPKTDPPAFKADRPMRRRVRVIPAATATEINYGQIVTEEASYYGKTNPRWNQCKLLCITAYGKLPEQVTGNGGISITVPTNGSAGDTTYNDIGDGNHRACIKVIQPPTASVFAAGSTNTVVRFPTGQIDIIDFYVEFN